MNVLALDTSGLIASVAACRDDEVLMEQSLDRGLEHGRLLLPLLDRVIGSAGWDNRRDVELIAVSQGPGSYTGLRVGLSCAKTLAVILKRPLVGVCSLDVLAENAPEDYEKILVVIDAKRDEVYAAAYEREKMALKRVVGPSVMSPAKAARLLTPPILVIGDGLRRHGMEFPQPKYRHASEELWRAKASAAARLGLAAFRAGRVEDPMGMEPIYLRLPAAEERRLTRIRAASRHIK